MSLQELRKFSNIELILENRNLPGESFSIQGVSKWIHSLLPELPARSDRPLHSHYVLKRGGMVAPKNEQRNNSFV
jgi:hypothetical protein